MTAPAASVIVSCTQEFLCLGRELLIGFDAVLCIRFAIHNVFLIEVDMKRYLNVSVVSVGHFLVDVLFVGALQVAGVSLRCVGHVVRTVIKMIVLCRDLPQVSCANELLGAHNPPASASSPNNKHPPVGPRLWSVVGRWCLRWSRW